MINVYSKSQKDCLRCCLAAVLERAYEEIPYVDPDLPVDQFWQEYEKAMESLEIDFSIVETKEGKNLKGFTIGIGKTRLGTDHAVVCFKGEIVFDPAVSSGIQSIDAYMVLVPMYPWKYNPGATSKNEYMTTEKPK